MPSDQDPDPREFTSHAPGYWDELEVSDWNDAAWQLRNRIASLEQLEDRIRLTPEERAGVLLSGSKLALGITPHFLNLVDGDDPGCPIRRQVIPRIEETNHNREEMSDPCGEDEHMPVPGLVHRYPDRVLFLVTDRCASYCRYCTRSRVVSGAGKQNLHTEFEAAFRYLEEHTEIRDVLFSGGDPLLLSDRKLDALLGRVRAMKHIEFIRIGTRIPVFLPQRITPELCGMLRNHHPLWMSVHVNHPRELTLETKEALERLSDHGIPLGNQSVLLRGVNDDAEVIRDLSHKLLRCRVRPYYLYQCDLISGSAHLRVPVSKGIEIIERLRGHTTGYAVPQLVVDAPGGGGKIPINPNYVIHHDEERLLVRNYEGKVFEYPEPCQTAEHSNPPDSRCECGCGSAESCA